MSCKHLYIGMPMYNSHTWIAVLIQNKLTVPTCLLCRSYAFQNSSWRSSVAASSIPTVNCGNNVWPLQVTRACAWCAAGIRMFCWPATPFCDPRGSPVRATWMGSLPSGFRLVWPMRSPGRKWEGERMRRVRSGYLFPWLPLPVVSHQDDCVPQWQVSLLWNVSVRSVPSTFC